VCQHGRVAWSVLVSPLHVVAADGGLEWAVAASFAYGIPERAPAAQPLPHVQDVLAAIASAGCHGTAWFTVEGIDVTSYLPPCTNPADCATAGGMDLGEVTLHPAGSDDKLRADSRVEAVRFRKPHGRALLHAVCGLTAAAGPLLVFDEDADRVFAVSPGDRPEDLAGHWPW
jgi:hypothetical protein